MIQKIMTNRKTESLAPKISESPNSIHPKDIIVFKSSSDMGVRRNFGKNGARFSPAAILNALKKLNDHFVDFNFAHYETTSMASEREDFEKAQKNSSSKILTLLEKYPQNLKIHLGGGHDHIFPFLKAIYESNIYENIVILNIDAHCDTRIENHSHSGTPFRDFDQLEPRSVWLFQYGIHSFSNSKSTLSPLEHINEEKIFFHEMREKKAVLLEKLKSFNPSTTAFVLSLDCDAIDASEFFAVSAPNPQGLSFTEVKDLLKSTTAIFPKYHFGIYEYNPVFDSPSGICAKRLASLIFGLVSNN